MIFQRKKTSGGKKEAAEAKNRKKILEIYSLLW